MIVGDGAPVLGVVGGGQLGRMLAEAAAPLGIEVVVADPSPNPPAAPVVRESIAGDFDDPETVRRLANRVDCLTFEIELADPELLERISTENDIPVHPSPTSLRITGDKLEEKRRLAENNIPVPNFRGVDSPGDLQEALSELGRPAMVKARHGGYDGRGNAPVSSLEEAEETFGDLSGLIAEELVDFDRELSAIGVKGAAETGPSIPPPNDDDVTVVFPVVENVHEAEILRTTVAPASLTNEGVDRATEVVSSVLDIMEGRGVFGVELFEVGNEILVNEIAPRPHNSGHYTIEGAVTSQFEQHVRAVLGWPLGAVSLRCPTVMANVLGDGSHARPARLMGATMVLETPGASLHWYGKSEVRPLRKMGHVTVIPTAGEGPASLTRTARSLTDSLAFA